MSPIPDQWRGPYAPRDPLNEPRPNHPWPTETTTQRVEQERDAFQRALASLVSGPGDQAR